MNAVKRMATGYQALTEKEKQTLRLIVRGHDAKSMARHLGLSVHTVNERLRDARRKLEVSSSREAARLVLDREGEDPQKLGDKPIGEAAAQGAMTQRDRPGLGTASASGDAARAWLIAGGVIMTVFFGILALATVPQSTTIAASAQAPAAVSVAEADVERAARDWLALEDAGRWRESYNATSKSFRKLNTLERWTEVAQKVRGPLGAVISRVAISQDRVPAPPHGVQVIKFRTSFANKGDAVERVSLAREDGSWKVVGIYID
jgi:DNA-binding CsgD family transcriptional regulator